MRGTQVVAEGTLSSGMLSGVPVAVRYDLQRRAGELTLDHAFRFSRPLLAGLWPGWDGPFDLASGKLRVQVALKVLQEAIAAKATRKPVEETAPAGIAGTVTASLEGAAGQFDVVVFRDLNARLDGAIQEDAFLLRASSVSIGLLDAGVPMRDVRTSVAGNSERLDVGETTAGLLGGRVRVEPFSYKMVDGYASVTARLEDIDLARVLELEGDDVTGDGTLDATLPLEVRDGAFLVRAGRVKARAPGGWIRLDPSLTNSLTQPGLSLALGALSDFRFKVLEADVDYQANGDLDLAVRLEGNNPEVQAGRDIHFNLTVSENIPVLLRSLRLQDSFTERIEERVRQ